MHDARDTYRANKLNVLLIWFPANARGCLGSRGTKERARGPRSKHDKLTVDKRRKIDRERSESRDRARFASFFPSAELFPSFFWAPGAPLSVFIGGSSRNSPDTVEFHFITRYVSVALFRRYVPRGNVRGPAKKCNNGAGTYTGKD